MLAVCLTDAALAHRSEVFVEPCRDAAWSGSIVVACEGKQSRDMHLDLSSKGTTAYAKQISTASLGDHSYIVVVGDEAVAVDIQRDLDRFEEVLSGDDANLVAVFETHIHNDYVSGGRRLADIHGATYVLPANTGAPYEHTPLSEGETIEVGGWVMRAMHTPGHTFNHTSYVLVSPSGPVAIFSGGSMLVGSVGRSDLLGPEHTEALLQHQFTSVRRIAHELTVPSLVCPTHGAGSFCAVGDASTTTSTIGAEKRQNPALTASSVEAFRTSQLLEYKRYPAYYRYMAPANLEPRGAPPIGDVQVVDGPDGIRGATIVDIRPFVEFADGHIPGSLSFEASNDAAVYMGWTLEWGSPLVLVGDMEQVEAVRVELQRIGWDDVVGRIDPSHLDTFTDRGLATIETVDFGDLDEIVQHPALDVRDPVEQRTGVIPGARTAHLADVAAKPDSYVEDGAVIVYCAGGYRSGIAASFIQAAGGRAIVVRDSLSNYRGTLAPSAQRSS